MTDFLPDRDLREPNSSVLVAAYYILRRQPWQAFAVKTWNAMKRFLMLALIAASVTALLPPAKAHARTYDVISADVPFKFTIGSRTFSPGHYQLIVVGPSLMTLRDSRKKAIASIVTRAHNSGGPLPVSKLVFDNEKKHSRLSEIWMKDHSQVFEVLGEELAMRPAPVRPAALPVGVNSLFDLHPEGALKH
ncbi:MAG TPA: hypothetical protein VFT65_17765 [Candidatus Angelobacter sp.]|nr:hypothetical protein [Candidatus Angelobacter sp.]